MKDRFIAYLDILGFKEQLKKISTEPSLEDNLIAALKTFKAKGDLTSDRRAVSCFSDLIVISYPIDTIVGMARDKLSENFNSLIKDCLILTIKLLEVGLIVRGGITVGKLYHKDQIILGEGLVEANNIEEKLAFYPRIIVKDTAIEKQGIGIEGFQSHSESYNNCLIKDFDWMIYLSYLSYSKEYFENEEQYKTFLTKVNHTKLKLHEDARNDYSIKSKAWWFDETFTTYLKTLPESIRSIVRPHLSSESI